jgi:hypothetical protein
MKHLGVQIAALSAGTIADTGSDLLNPTYSIVLNMLNAGLHGFVLNISSF